MHELPAHESPRPLDPDAEAARLAEARDDPPSREWGIRHPDGSVSVFITGHAYASRRQAEAARRGMEIECDCAGDPGEHRLVYRDKPPWQDAP